MGTVMLTRRGFLLAGVSLALAGCGLNPVLKAMTGGSGRKDKRWTAEEIRQLPYASMGARVGKSRQALVVLAKNINDSLYWVSTNQVLIVTRRGRLIRTNGLIKDLKTTRFGGADPVQTGLHRMQPANNRLIRFVDLRPGEEHERDVAATSVFRVVGEEQITILERPRLTVKVEERVSHWRWNWHVKNQYWADPATGFVWKSVQHIAPQIAALEIEIFKPAA